VAKRPFTRRSGGGVNVRLSDPEREVLASIAPELREMLATGDDDALRRLFPPAHADDAAAESDYRSLVHDELLRKRLDDLDVLERTADATELSEEQAEQWMHAINGLRLVLGTRLDVSEDLAPAEPDDPDAGAHALYEYLGYLLEMLLNGLRP
jgi:hypothetical protein